jgi:hypothetical protein
MPISVIYAKMGIELTCKNITVDGIVYINPGHMKTTTNAVIAIIITPKNTRISVVRTFPLSFLAWTIIRPVSRVIANDHTPKIIVIYVIILIISGSMISPRIDDPYL